MLNKVMLIGRLGQDPELRYTKSGMPMTTLNVATDETYTDRDGNRQKTTEWHRVVVFQRLAENCCNYLGKGSLVYVDGSLQTRKWQDQNGQDRYTTEIRARNVQFLDRRSDRPQEGAGQEDMEAGGHYGGQRSPRRGGQQQWQGGEDYSPPPQDQWGGGPDSWNSAAPKAPRSQEPDLGPAFPSEAATMDKVPF